MTLETEIVKAQARERVYASLEENHVNLESKDDTVPLSSKINLISCLQRLRPRCTLLSPSCIETFCSVTAHLKLTTVLVVDHEKLLHLPTQTESYEKSFEDYEEGMVMQPQQNVRSYDSRYI